MLCSITRIHFQLNPRHSLVIINIPAGPCLFIFLKESRFYLVQSISKTSYIRVDVVIGRMKQTQMLNENK